MLVTQRPEASVGHAGEDNRRLRSGDTGGREAGHGRNRQNAARFDKTARRRSAMRTVIERDEPRAGPRALKGPTMPMIDVYAAADLFPADADRRLAEELTAALLKAEGVVSPGPTHTNNTAAYIHRLPPSAVNTAAAGATPRTVRVQVLTPPGVLNREGQKQLVADVTQIVLKHLRRSPARAGRTWVLLTEAAEGGWGIAGTAFGARGVRRARGQRRNSPRRPSRLPPTLSTEGSGCRMSGRRVPEPHAV